MKLYACNFIWSFFYVYSSSDIHVSCLLLKVMSVVQSVVAQKKLYYNVRVHAMQQKAKGTCQLLKDKMADQRTSLLSRIRQLHHCLKWVCSMSVMCLYIARACAFVCALMYVCIVHCVFICSTAIMMNAVYILSNSCSTIKWEGLILSTRQLPSTSGFHN